MRLDRRSFLSSLLVTCAVPAWADAPTQAFRPKPRTKTAPKRKVASLNSLVASANLSGVQGIVVMDLGTGQILEQMNGNALLPPASVTKVVTTLYALENPGPNFQFKTQIVATGPIVSGKIKGDLILVGSGDPHLDTDGLAKLAKALQAKGITGITGKYKVYGGALPYQRSIDKGQPDHVGYNPSISGLNLNFNRVHFEWKRSGNSYKTTMEARTNNYRPAVKVAKISMAARSSPLYTYKSSNGVDRWTVARGALGRGGSRWLPVRQPVAYTGEVFRSLARLYGLRLPDPSITKTRPSGTILASQSSAGLQNLSKSMLKFSTNLTAEVVGLTASKAANADPKNLKSSAQAMTKWASARFDVKSARFVDHSGLGDGSRISAKDMTQILVKSGWNGPLRPLLKDIPLKNSKGKRAPISGVSVIAKTGTLNFASALVGYITLPNRRRLAFTIFTADLKKRSQIGRADRERPAGSRTWVKTSKNLQMDLIRRWAGLYG